MEFLFYFILFAIILFVFNFKKNVNYIGKYLSKRILKITKKENYFTFISQIKTQRFFIILILLLITLGLSYFIILIFSKASVNMSIVFYVFFVLFIFIFSILLYKRETIFSVDFSNNELAGFTSIVETISISTGITSPKVVLLPNKNPQIFLISSLFISKPTLYVTTSFLREFSKIEIENSVAHEISNLITGEIYIWKTIEIFIILLEVLSIFVFALFLFFIDNTIFYIWISLFFVYQLSPILPTFIKNDDFSNSTVRNEYTRAVFFVFNPVYLLVIFIAQILRYISYYNETICADMKSIELTRYPQGLYSALLKMQFILKQERDNKIFSPYSSFLFVGETNSDFTQAPIEDRKDLLLKIDPSITDTYSPVKLLCCSSCGDELKFLTIKNSRYENIKLLVCDKCGFIWFNSHTFYFLSAIDSVEEQLKKYFMSKKVVQMKSDYICPECGLKLEKLQDSNIPKDINIYECNFCQGNFVSYIDFIKYAEYRKNK